jgi:biotin operon repressor
VSPAAGALGLHVPFVRRRCEALRRDGCPVESDTRFRLTREGRLLADATDLAGPLAAE